MKKVKDEDGAIMLEFAMVMSLVLIVVAFMLGFGFFICQKTMCYTIATETASYIGDSYKYTGLNKIDETEVSGDKMKNLKNYRTSFALLSMRNNSKSKTDKYVKERAKLTSFTPDKSASVKDIQFYSDNIGRTHVKVTVNIESNVLFLNILQAVGLIGKTPDFTATACAECIDITGYASQMSYLKYLGDKLNDTNIGGAYNNVADSLKDVKEIINKIIK